MALFIINLNRVKRIIRVKQIVLLLLLVSFQGLQAQTTESAIRGTVKTQDGQAAESVTIRLKKSGQQTKTDSDGNFVLRAVAEGSQSLEVRLLGFLTKTVSVNINAGESVTLPTITLQQDSKALKEILITGSINGFAKKKTDYVARMPLENLENPQVYNVVTKELLKEQVVVNYQEALRNAPGVLTSVYPAGGFAANLRGFISGVNHRNGMASVSNTKSLDPVNIERIEVIKGPSGTLYGSSAISFGGLINEVTKRPFDEHQTEISYTSGSWNLNRLTADVNAPLNADKTALFRVNMALHQEKSFQTYGHKNSFALAPSLAYKVNDRFSFVIDAEILYNDRTQTIFPTYSSGTTFKNLNDLPIAYERSLGGEDMDSRSFSNQVVLEGRYKINDHLTSITNVSYNANQDHSNQIYVTWQNDDLIARRVSSSGPRLNTNLQVQQNFVYDATVGKIRNRLLAGVDFYQSMAKQNSYAQFAYDTVSLSQPISPVSAPKIKAMTANLSPNYNESHQNTYSVYFSDVIDFTSRLNAMVSLRLDRYENKPYKTNGVAAATGDFNQTALSPKLGLVYQVVKDQVSLFGNYMNGFANVAPFTQPDGEISIFKPRHANQLETGVKAYAFQHRLNVTASFYDIQVSNATRRTDDGFTVQDGTQKSKGFEVEVIANPVNGLNLNAGYAYNDSYYTKASAALEGKKVQATPEHIYNFWLSYKFNGPVLNNVGVGAGGNYVSKSFFDSGNTFIIPAYTVVNATVFYDQPKWRLGLKVNNLTNEKYWDRYSNAQATKQWLATLAVKF